MFHTIVIRAPQCQLIVDSLPTKTIIAPTIMQFGTTVILLLYVSLKSICIVLLHMMSIAVVHVSCCAWSVQKRYQNDALRDSSNDYSSKRSGRPPKIKDHASSPRYVLVLPSCCRLVLYEDAGGLFRPHRHLHSGLDEISQHHGSDPHSLIFIRRLSVRKISVRSTLADAQIHFSFWHTLALSHL